MKNKIVLFAIFALLIFSTLSFAIFGENIFIDVGENEYYYGSVDWAIANNITQGTSENTFSPEEYCTRAQVVTFLYRAAGEPEITINNNQFVDVSSQDYYYNAVQWAINNKITNGTSSKTFSPNEICTRAQIITFVYRSVGEPQTNNKYTNFVDVDKNEFYYNSLLWSLENGITKGVDSTHFSPNEFCNRAQSITLIYRTVQNGRIIGNGYYQTISSPANNETVCLIGSLYKNFLKNYTLPGCSINYIDGNENLFPVPAKFDWSEFHGAKEYELRISLNKDLSDYISVSATEDTADVYNLFTGRTYYYTITAKTENKDYTSKIFTFKTYQSPRLVLIGDNVNYVSNVRDIGGYSVSETQRVKQGMVLRGSALNEVSSNIRNVLQQYWYEIGIKTEIDVRSGKDGSPGRLKTNYVNVRGAYYAREDTGLGADESKVTMRKVLSAFIDENNYPIYLHCQIGRDRTGTAIGLLEALIGISEKDILIDYESSYFSKAGSYHWNTTESPSTMLEEMQGMIDWLKKTYKASTLKECAEMYVLEIGLTKEEIESIRNILIEDIT